MGLLASCLQDVSLKRGGDCCWRKKGGVVFTACLFALFASHQVPFSSNQMGDRLNHTPGRREQSTPLKKKKMETLKPAVLHASNVKGKQPNERYS